MIIFLHQNFHIILNILLFFQISLISESIKNIYLLYLNMSQQNQLNLNPNSEKKENENNENIKNNNNDTIEKEIIKINRFEKLKELQSLIKKESAMKELCKIII